MHHIMEPPFCLQYNTAVVESSSKIRKNLYPCFHRQICFKSMKFRRIVCIDIPTSELNTAYRRLL